MRSPGAPFVWVALLAGLLFLFFSAPAAFAQRSPPGCTGSGLGISLFTSLPDVHIGDTIRYSVNVFNAPFPACDAGDTNVASAGAIYAFIVTPDGVTNNITLLRTFLAPGASDYYSNVVSYVVRAQDIRPDGTVRATAIDEGDIWQNDTHSRGGGNQGVNTEVNLPCVLIAAQCVSSVGENGAITFTGTVTNCGNNTLVGVTVTNFNDTGTFTVLFPTNLAVGQVASFSGSWVPLNPCGPSMAILTVRATDEFTSTPRTLTNFTTITCQNTLTPGINVTKACPAQPVSPGQLLTFSGSVSNTGNVTLTNIVVVDSQPAANTPVFTLASLAPGAAANFTGSYTAPTNCSVTDTLTATANSRCGVGVSSIASATCPILTTPQIAVTAVCPATPAVSGGTLTYSGTVRNTGDITLTNIVVVSDRPAPNTTVFTLATLPPGASANFTSSLTVPADACSVTTTFSGRGQDLCTANPVTNTISTTCPITTAPAIAVTLACPATPVATGGLITYSGTVRNSGNVTLNNVAVVNNEATVLTVPSLAPGVSANFTASFTAPADACSVSSTVTASGSDSCTQAVVNNSASATCTLVTTPRIAVTQNCPANPPGLGGVLTYSGTVSNAGNITLTNVVVTDNLTGASTVFTVAALAPGASSSFTGSYTVPANSGCAVTSTLTANASDKCTGALVTANATATCPVQGAPNIAVTLGCPDTPTPLGGLLTFSGTVRNGGTITLTNVVVVRDAPAPNTTVFSAASLAPGASANFTGSYTVPGSEACSIATSVSASANDQCAGSGVVARATISCPLVSTPGIVVTQNCPVNPASPGGVLTYSGTVSNAGNITLTNIVVLNNQPAANTVVFTQATLASGESTNFTASYTVPSSSVCSITAVVTANANDICSGNAVTSTTSATCPLTMAPSIAVTLNCPEVPAATGGIITYHGTVSNPGNVALNNVVVVDSQASPSTVLTVPSLAPGGSANFTASFTAPANACSVSSTVTASGSDACVGTVVTNFASATCPLSTAPAIAVTLACPAVPVATGGLITYSGTVRNSGNVTLNNVAVVNNQASPSTVFTVASLAPGVSANFTASFTAPVDACSVSSAVTASGSDACTSALVSASASATCALTAAPSIVVTQVCPESPAGPGSMLTYSGTVRNTGNITLTNVVVLNTLSGATPVFTSDSLAPGATASFTGSYLTPTNCSGTSTATTTARSVCGVAVSNSSTVTCTILTTPQISVTAVCPTAPVAPGGTLTYSGTVRNTGNITLKNVVVVSDRPAANTTVFTAPTLAPGASAAFTGSYTVPADACSLTANLRATGQDQCTDAAVTSTFASTCNSTTAPAIAVTLACPTGGSSSGVDIAQGKSATQSSTYFGQGAYYVAGWAVDGNTSGVWWDYSMSLTAAEPNAWWQVDLGSVHDLQTINIWGRTDGYPEEYSNLYVLVSDNPIPASLQSATNQPGVSAYYQPGIMGRPTAILINRTGRYVKVQLAGTDYLALPEVQVYETPTVTNVGPIITYSGTVRNSGNVTLNNVVVVNDHPAPNTVVLTVPSLAAGASANFTASFNTPLDACSVSSTVNASGSDTCSGATVNATASATCPLVTTPLIVVTQNCPPTPTSLGGVLTYSGTVSNAGDITLTNVVVTNDRTGTEPVFNIATLAPGASASFTGSYTVPAASACAITSTLTGIGYDNCSGARVAATASSTCPLLTAPLITVTQTCPVNLVSAGGILTYSGTVRNAGDITLTNIVVVNNRPAANTVIFTAASLAPGASANFSGSYEVPINCCVVWSTATASGQDTCDGTTVTDTDTTTCTVLTAPKIVVTKVCPPAAAQPGDVLHYSGTVSNAGNITLVNVTIVNSQPGEGSPVFGPITLAPGESASYFASYVVPPDFCGTDTITAQGFDACTFAPVVNSVTTTCPILTTPRIAVTKDCPAQPTPRGGVFTFTGTVSNPGDVTLINVMVANNYQADCYSRTNGSVIGPITLAPGASVNFSGSYIAPLSCCEVIDTLTASGQDRCAGTRVTATATAACPLLSTPRITVTRICPPAPVNGVFAYSGSVSNAGDVVLTNVFVLSTKPNANTSVLGPIALAPGETQMFSGSYTVTADSNPLTDTVTASGTDICQGRTVTATANCFGPVGPLIVSSVTIANGTATVTWMAKSGVTYRLQWASNNQNSVWNNAPGDVTATGDTASKNDAVGSAKQRFYRVMVVQ